MDLTPEEYAEKLKNDDTFLKAAYDQAIADIEAESDENYDINPPQWAKFIDAFAFFQRITSEPDSGCMEKCELIPKKVCGHIDGKLTYIGISHENVDEIISVLRKLDSITLMPELDGTISFSATVRDVFKKK